VLIVCKPTPVPVRLQQPRFQYKLCSCARGPTHLQRLSRQSGLGGLGLWNNRIILSTSAVMVYLLHLYRIPNTACRGERHVKDRFSNHGDDDIMYRRKPLNISSLSINKLLLIMKKTLIILIALLLLSILAFSHRDWLLITYIKTFKKTTSLLPSDKDGKVNGEALSFKDGQLVYKGTLKNGKRDGWLLSFYDNGEIKTKTFYKSDKEDGDEIEYYPNGVIKFQATLKSGIQYGNYYYYSEKGVLKAYHALDILGKKFNLIWLDSSGKVIKHQGYVTSNRVFSEVNGQSIILSESNTLQNDIKDLYITVAQPTFLGLSLAISVNGKDIKNYEVKNSTIHIPDLFKKSGTYRINVSGRLTGSKVDFKQSDAFEITLRK
jgi:hypothetical protein